MDKSTRNFIIVMIVGALAFGYSTFKRSDLAGSFITSFGGEGKKIDAIDLDFKKLPLFKAKELYSEEMINSQQYLKGSKGVVHFFATWCAPCIEELPKLLKYATENIETKFLLVASKDKKRKLLKLFKTLSIPQNCTIVQDPDTSIMDRFWSERIPESFFFDKESLLNFKIAGVHGWR